MARIEKVITVVTDADVRVTLSPADMFAIRFMLGMDNEQVPRPVPTIKYVRLQNPSIGLKDAKDVVDALRNNPSAFN